MKESAQGAAAPELDGGHQAGFSQPALPQFIQSSKYFAEDIRMWWSDLTPNTTGRPSEFQKYVVTKLLPEVMDALNFSKEKYEQQRQHINRRYYDEQFYPNFKTKVGNKPSQWVPNHRK